MTPAPHPRRVLILRAGSLWRSPHKSPNATLPAGSDPRAVRTGGSIDKMAGFRLGRRHFVGRRLLPSWIDLTRSSHTEARRRGALLSTRHRRPARGTRRAPLTVAEYRRIPPGEEEGRNLGKIFATLYSTYNTGLHRLSVPYSCPHSFTEILFSLLHIDMIP